MYQLFQQYLRHNGWKSMKYTARIMGTAFSSYNVHLRAATFAQ